MPAASSAPRTTASQLARIWVGSCSTHPGCGNSCACSRWLEPTGCPAASKTIARVLDVARERGASTLIIEHNVELVAEVCDHIVVMDAGRVLRTGSADEVMTDQSVIDAYLGS